MSNTPKRSYTQTIFRREEIDLLHRMINGMLLSQPVSLPMLRDPAFATICHKVKQMKDRVEDAV